MSDWIGLGIIVVLIICAVAGLSLLGKPYEVTQEEFDRRAKEAPGALSAGVMGLQKILQPELEKAAITQEDFKQGYLDGEQESGEGDDDGEEGKKANG